MPWSARPRSTRLSSCGAASANQIRPSTTPRCSRWTTRRARFVQEEVFGPVATFEVFESEGDAVRLANVTQYGLAASIWSRDIDRPRRVGRQLRAGTVWTNTWALVADQFEEGGFGQSGLGRLNGMRRLEEFQEYKTYAQIVA